MARAIWKGSINFGLVNIPVALHSAEIRPDISLRMLDSRDNNRVRYERVNEATGEEVPWDSIVKGYEFDEDKYVLLSEEEMKNVRAEVTKSVEIEDFVDVESIDPTFFDKPYFLVPEKKHKPAYKSYALLRETLRKTKKVGIAKVVIRTREYLCAVMVQEDMLILNLLRFAQELRDPSEYEVPGDDFKELKLSDKEIEMASKLVETMTSNWEPMKYEDSYRTALMEWIEKKIEEGHLETSSGPEDEEEEKPVQGKVVDLMDYLKQSVEEATEERKKPAKKSKKKASSKKASAKKKSAKKKASGGKKAS